jgi:hypothetical protein
MEYHMPCTPAPAIEIGLKLRSWYLQGVGATSFARLFDIPSLNRRNQNQNQKSNQINQIQLTNQINYNQPTNSTNQPTNQPTNQITNQLTNQPNPQPNPTKSN